MAVFLWKVKQFWKPAPLSLILLPLIFALILGTLTGKQVKELTVPIGIIDEDDSDVSKEITSEMKKQEKLKVFELSADEAGRMLDRNELDSVFVFKKGFKERLMEEKREETVVLMTSSSSVAAPIVKEVFAGETTKWTAAIMAANKVKGLDDKSGEIKDDAWNEAYDYALRQWHPEPLMTIEHKRYGTGDKKTEVEEGNPSDRNYLGLWSFFACIAASLAGKWIVDERGHLFARIRSTGKGLMNYWLQVTASDVLLLMIQVSLSLTVFAYQGLAEWSFKLLLAMCLFILYAYAIGVSLALIMRHKAFYMVTVFFTAVCIGVFGESFLPITEISASLVRITQWFPQSLMWDASGTGTAYSWLPSCLSILMSWLIMFLIAKRRLS